MLHDVPLTMATQSRDVHSPAVPAILGPAEARERNFAVDALRGFAILGILLMNLPAMGLPFELEFNPVAYGHASSTDIWTWIFDSVLFEGKFRAIFSMLYGASVVLLTSRLSRRASGADVADIYYRRTLWLLFFGLAHICLVWHGDVLFIFGVCGLVLFPFRNVSPRNLIIAGLVVFCLLAAKHFSDFRAIQSARDSAVAANAAQDAGKTLTEAQRRSQNSWVEDLKRLQPSQDAIAQEIRYHLGSYWKGVADRTANAGLTFGLFGYPYESLGMMLIGMGLLKMGVFSAERSYSEYTLMAIVGFAVGLPSASYVVWRNVRDNFLAGEFFTATCCGHLKSPTYDLERLAVGLAYVAVFMLLLKAKLVPRLMSYLAAAGRMTLTNYLMQTIICLCLFQGFGLYARLHRLELILYILVPMWIFQLAFSVMWLRCFRFGPIEWLWRSLTYWKLQQLRIAVAGDAIKKQRHHSAPLRSSAQRDI